MKKLLFISGLPRSGSTLFSALLMQNEKFHAGIVSPVAALINSCMDQLASGKEFYSCATDTKRLAIAKGIFDSFYEDIDKECIFDTNRMWTAHIDQLVQMYGDGVRVVCLVRNPAWVVDSFERLARKQPLTYSKLYKPEVRGNVYSRCESLMKGTVGASLNALREGFFGEHSNKMLLLDYDLLTSDPAEAMKLFYDFTGLEFYQHDFDNVEYSDNEFDEAIGIKDMHTVRRKIKYKKRQTILPPDLFDRYSALKFW
jgi:sulfotransferase